MIFAEDKLRNIVKACDGEAEPYRTEGGGAWGNFKMAPLRAKFLPAGKFRGKMRAVHSKLR